MSATGNSMLLSAGTAGPAQGISHGAALAKRCKPAQNESRRSHVEANLSLVAGVFFGKPPAAAPGRPARNPGTLRSGRHDCAGTGARHGLLHPGASAQG